MKMQLELRGAAVLAVTVFISLGFASPSAATVYSFDTRMIDGSIDLNDFMFTPSDLTIEGCPGDLGITGDVSTTTGAVSGTLEVYLPFVGIFDSQDYVIEASSVATTEGAYNSSDNSFTNLHFSNVAFVIAEFDREMCTVGEEVCLGLATLTLSGGLNTGASFPLGTGEQLYANGYGGITSVPFTTCDFLLWLLLSGGDLSIGPNTDTWIDPGAIFEQV